MRQGSTARRGTPRSTALALSLALIAMLVIAMGPSAIAGTEGWPGPPPAAGDWPQVMRGNHHLGLNRVETTLTPATVHGLSIAWTQPLEVSGYAPASGSPIVVGPAVFVGGAAVVRRRVDTGALEWRTVIGGGIPTTPAYAHGIVVATDVQANSVIAGLDASTGAVLWTRHVRGNVSSSPSISGGTVFVGFFRAGEYGVLALKLRNGAPRWRWTTSDATFGLVSSPTTDGSGVYFSLGGGTRVVALDAATGAERWDLHLDSGNGWTMDGMMVSVLGGRLYAGNVAGAVYSIDVATGHVVWRTDVGGPVYRPVAATPHAILAVRDVESVVALSPADGSVLWTYTILGTMSPGVATAAGVVYVGANIRGAGRMDALSIRTGRRRARIDLVGTFEPMIPAVSAGRVFVAEWDSLMALTLPPSGVRRAELTPIARERDSAAHPVAPVFEK
jgi:outer membrane protein assembly factor BamB